MNWWQFRLVPHTAGGFARTETSQVYHLPCCRQPSVDNWKEITFDSYVRPHLLAQTRKSLLRLRECRGLLAASRA